ncbi:hypothetical protein BJ165DRAFT_1401340 [Panaeolus papilionaceus]|nr:hypothetical protein BJ165DRAFT_1401340 [Panaeolus papilionaceus]
MSPNGNPKHNLFGNNSTHPLIDPSIDQYLEQYPTCDCSDPHNPKSVRNNEFPSLMGRQQPLNWKRRYIEHGSRLVEDTSKILLGRLNRLCEPDPGKDGINDADVSESWQTHLEDTIRHLNQRLVPLLGFSLNELLLRLVINTPSTSTHTAHWRYVRTRPSFGQPTWRGRVRMGNSKMLDRAQAFNERVLGEDDDIVVAGIVDDADGDEMGVLDFGQEGRGRGWKR